MGQHDGYSNPSYGVSQRFETDVTGALNGTVGATELFRYKMTGAKSITGINVRYKAGGTGALRQIIVGTASSGGAMTAIGTGLLGTQATNTTKTLAITGTVQDGDELVFQHLGTDAIVYNVSFGVVYKEKFIQA